jgi:glycosyltransferase involved in cell wall biosynthesis
MLFVAPVLPLDVRMMAETLEAAGLLSGLVTRWTFTAGELKWARRGGLPLRWQRRTISPVSPKYLHRVWWADIAYELNRRRHHSKIRATDASFARVDQRAAKLITAATRAVIGREDACQLVFQKANDQGVRTIYQLPTAHCATVRQLVLQEAQEFPEAFDRSELEIDFAPERMERKQQELKAAQYILCPSQFVQRSVQAAGVPPERITTIPLGIDSHWQAPQTNHRKNVFLYVGNITARKGAHRLLRVWKKLGAYRTHTLRLIGDMNLPPAFLAEHAGCFEHVPRLLREALIPHYSEAQAFVFNAMADGFGHVFAEAMVCGTAVLCSKNSGAPDLVSDGVEGRLFDYGDDDQLATVLEWALSHPTELAEMGVQGRQRALRWGWDEFGEVFLTWIQSTIGQLQTPMVTSLGR